MTLPKVNGWIVALAAVLTPALAQQASAQVFTVTNTSNRKVNVVICYYNPGQSGQLADGTSIGPGVPASWNLKGWWVVQPGQTMRIASGSGEHVYVRLEYDNGELIRPDRPRGKPLTFNVPRNKFERSSDIVSPTGTSPLEGFYPYPVNDVFTVR